MLQKKYIYIYIIMKVFNLIVEFHVVKMRRKLNYSSNYKTLSLLKKKGDVNQYIEHYDIIAHLSTPSKVASKGCEV